jgi:hypothetical protein
MMKAKTKTPRTRLRMISMGQQWTTVHSSAFQRHAFYFSATVVSVVSASLAELIFSVVAFVSMSYNAGFMMMASTTVEEGGLGLGVRHLPELLSAANITQPLQLGTMLAISSVLGVAVAAILTPHLARRFGWYKATRYTSLGHVILFPMIAVTGIVAQTEGRAGLWTLMCMGVVLVSHEIGETSFSYVE